MRIFAELKYFSMQANSCDFNIIGSKSDITLAISDFSKNSSTCLA